MQMIKGRKSYVIMALICVFSVALAFSAASLITNAQLTTDVNLINIKAVYKTVWYREPISSSGYLVSTMLSSWGRGRIHVLIEEYGLTGSETLTFRFWAPLYRPDKNAYVPIRIAEWTLDTTTQELHPDLDVPTGQFYFAVYGPVGRQASLSYYLSV